MRVSCTVNGEPQQADDVWEGESLLYLLRERLGFPGSKNACEQGECGSCTVYLDGVLACACLVAAGQAQGRDVRTVDRQDRRYARRTDRQAVWTARRAIWSVRWSAMTARLETALTAFAAWIDRTTDGPAQTEAGRRVDPDA